MNMSLENNESVKNTWHWFSRGDLDFDYQLWDEINKQIIEMKWCRVVQSKFPP